MGWSSRGPCADLWRDEYLSSSEYLLSCVNDPGSHSPAVRGPGSGYALLSLPFFHPQRTKYPFPENNPMTRWPGGLGYSTSPRGAFDDRHVLTMLQVQCRLVLMWIVTTASKQPVNKPRVLKMKLGTKWLAVVVFKRYSSISRMDNNPQTRTLASAASDRAMLL